MELKLSKLFLVKFNYNILIVPYGIETAYIVAQGKENKKF